ncbi:hypothetical protein WJX72_010239 [[Myrmecia] bisecta]|uniref:Uncharacterized protein n=1 Tax=[Myrmecia] bisecta TaxID=41462 RepID=A0AAW1Q1N1_9CHLO
MGGPLRHPLPHSPEPPEPGHRWGPGPPPLVEFSLLPNLEKQMIGQQVRERREKARAAAEHKGRHTKCVLEGLAAAAKLPTLDLSESSVPEHLSMSRTSSAWQTVGASIKRANSIADGLLAMARMSQTLGGLERTQSRMSGAFGGSRHDGESAGMLFEEIAEDLCRHRAQEQPVEEDPLTPASPKQQHITRDPEQAPETDDDEDGDLLTTRLLGLPVLERPLAEQTPLTALQGCNSLKAMLESRAYRTGSTIQSQFSIANQVLNHRGSIIPPVGEFDLVFAKNGAKEMLQPTTSMQIPPADMPQSQPSLPVPQLSTGMEQLSESEAHGRFAFLSEQPACREKDPLAQSCDEIAAEVQANVLLGEEASPARHWGELARLQRRYGNQEDGTTFDLRNSLGGAASLASFTEFMRQQPQICRLLLQSNGLDDAGCVLLVKALLQSGCNIQELVLSHNKLTKKACSLLLPLLNPLDTKPGSRHSRVVTPGRGLVELRLEDNAIGDRGAEVLCDALSGRLPLRLLDLSRCGLTERAASALQHLLEVNDTLQVLLLGWNGLGAKGAAAIANSLKYNNKLQELSLQWNGLGDKGGSFIANALESNDGIRLVDLSGNQIEGGTCSLLSEALKKNTRLQGLLLRDNPLGRAGACRLLQALHAGQLKRLDIRGCSFLPATANGAKLFNPYEPNGVHELDLSDPMQRQTATELVSLWQTHGASSWQSAALNGKTFTLTTRSNWPNEMPSEGRLVVDFLVPKSTKIPAKTARTTPLTEAEFVSVWEEVCGGAAPAVTDQWRMSLLEVLCSDAYFTAAHVIRILACLSYAEDRVDALVKLFGRIVDLEHLDKVTATFNAKQLQLLDQRLGVLRLFHPRNPTGMYSLTLSHQAQRAVAERLLETYVRQYEEGVCSVPLSTCWVHPTYNSTAAEIKDPRDYILPKTGLLDLCFADLRAIPPGAKPITRQRFLVLIANLVNNPQLDYNHLLDLNEMDWMDAVVDVVKRLRGHRMNVPVDVTHRKSIEGSMPQTPSLPAPKPAPYCVKDAANAVAAIRTFAVNNYVMSFHVIQILKLLPSSAEKVEVASGFWARTVDRKEQWSEVIRSLGREEQVMLCQRLGYMTAFDPQRPEMHYRLRMWLEDEYQVAFRLCKLAGSAKQNCLFNYMQDGVEKKVAEGANLWSMMRGNAEENTLPHITLDFDFVWPDQSSRLKAAKRIQSVRSFGACLEKASMRDMGIVSTVLVLLASLICTAQAAGHGRQLQQTQDANMLQQAQQLAQSLTPEASADLKPGYHITPISGWMNDPNGMMQYRGMYHMFFQYNPLAEKWGNPHWGHVVSSDLVHWMRLPDALIPDTDYDYDGIFSGSATILPDGTPGLMYTGVSKFAELNSYYQVQAMAMPVNHTDPMLVRWRKYRANPIIAELPAGGTYLQFRDPVTPWMGPDNTSYTMIGAQVDCQGAAPLYSSEDQLTWKFEGTFLSQSGIDAEDTCLDALPSQGACDQFGACGHAWECPDYWTHGNIQVFKWSDQINNRIPFGNDYYVLSDQPLNYSNAAVGDNGIFVPQYKGRTYQAQWFDYGQLYAAKSFQDESGRRLWISWILEDSYSCNIAQCGAGTVFTSAQDFMGVQTLPREVTYNAVSGELQLNPVKEVELLRNGTLYNGTATLGGADRQTAILPLGALNSSQPGALGRQMDLTVQFNLALPANASSPLPFTVGAVLSTSNGSYTVIQLTGQAAPASNGTSIANATMSADRSMSGGATNTSSAARQSGPVIVPAGSPLNLRIFVDHSVIEVFAVDGHGRLTTRIYPVAYNPQSWGLALFGTVGSGSQAGQVASDATVYAMGNTWVEQVSPPNLGSS